MKKRESEKEREREMQTIEKSTNKQWFKMGNPPPIKRKKKEKESDEGLMPTSGGTRPSRSRSFSAIGRYATKGMRSRYLVRRPWPRSALGLQTKAVHRHVP